MPLPGMTNRPTAWEKSSSMNLDRVIRRVVAYPLSSMEIEPGLRRGLLARFPYGNIYGQDNAAVVVVAVAHLHREPRYWADRVK